VSFVLAFVLFSFRFFTRFSYESRLLYAQFGCITTKYTIVYILSQIWVGKLFTVLIDLSPQNKKKTVETIVILQEKARI